MKKGVYMKKTQIKLIEKARKEGMSEDSLTLLSREDFTVRTLTYFYNMIKSGISVKDIEKVISDCGGSLYWNMNLLEKGYTPDEIHSINDMWNDYYTAKNYNAINCIGKIIETKPKNESDSSLRIAYTKFCAENDIHFSDKIINFAIANHIPVNEFKQEYTKYADGQDWMYSRIPGIEYLKGDDANWNHVDTCMSSDEIKAITDTVRRFYTTKSSSVIFTDKPSYRMDVELSAQAINIKLYYSAETRLYMFKDAPVYSYNMKKETELVVFYSGDTYISKNKRLFPLSMKEIGRIYERYGSIGHRVCNFLFAYTKAKLNAPVMTDIYRTLQADGFLNLPISFNDCRDMHNCNQLFKYRWKDASYINWNKADINIAYAIMKSLPVVRAIDQRRLLQHTSDKNLLPASKYFVAVKHSSQRRVIYFLKEYIATYGVTNTPDSIDLVYIFADYYNLCRKLHEKVSIGFKSCKKLVEAHDDMSKRERNRLHRVSVPKDSRFNELRKLLPKNFEWVKGGKRLQQEGITMNHCVNSYYSYINEDKIAVYHLTMPDGYMATIAFVRTKRGKYSISQMFGYHNEECPQEVWDYVYGFLRPKKKREYK